MRFGPDRAAARRARRVALLLAPAASVVAPESDGESNRLGLVVSELVMNVIEHTSDGGCLSVWSSRDRSSVRIEVADSRAEFPLLPRMGFDPERVHGLQLVNHYCSSWGVAQSQDGKIVWAELPDMADQAVQRFDGSRFVTPARPVERDVSAPREAAGAGLNGCLIADIDDALAELVMVGDFDLPELLDIVPTLTVVSHAPPPLVTIDLGGVSYIGAAGARTLVHLAEGVRLSGSRFVVVGASRLVNSVIDATGCRHILGDDHRPRGFKPR